MGNQNSLVFLITIQKARGEQEESKRGERAFSTEHGADQIAPFAAEAVERISTVEQELLSLWWGAGIAMRNKKTARARLALETERCEKQRRDALRRQESRQAIDSNDDDDDDEASGTWHINSSSRWLQ